MERSVLQQVTELTGMPYKAMKERWRSLYGTDPPAYKREHMIRRLAYRIQELAYGGLSQDAKAELERIADENPLPDQAARRKQRQGKTARPLPGTRLIREWNGQRHEVTASAEGLEYNGRRYRSLSAVAKAITGAHWSGPQFFGLRTPRKDGAQ